MFARMRLGTRIGIGFGVLLTLLLLVGIWCLHEMSILSRLNQDLYNHPFSVSTASLRIEGNIVKIHRNMKDIVLTDDPTLIQRYAMEVNQLESQALEDFKIIGERFLGEKRKYQAALAKFKQWRPIRQEVIALLHQLRRKEAAEITRGKGAAHVDSILLAMHDLHEFARNKAAAFFNEARQRSMFAHKLMYGVMIGALMLGIAFTVIFTRKVFKTEEELRDDKNFIDNALDSQIDTFFVFDPKTGQALHWNKAFREISGYSDEEIAANKAPDSYYDDRGLAKAAAAIEDLDTTGFTEVQLDLINKDGGRVPTEYTAVLVPDDAGKPKHIISVGRDITQRRQAEKALREREALLNEVGDIAKIGGWEVDLATNQLKWTKSTYDLSGFELDDQIPDFNQQMDFYLPEFHRVIQTSIKKLIKNDEPADFEALLKTPQGEVKWVRVMGHAIRENGRAVRLVGTIQDISEQKETQEKMANLDAQLRQAQKMEALGTLAGGIAHDFNNILSAIMGYSELTLDDLDENSPLRNNLEQIMKSSWRARNLVAQLLAYSRKQVLELKAFNINDVVEQNLPMLERIIGEDIELKTYLPPEAGVVRADLHQLDQVLLNLVANARDAMPTGGKLTIETSNVVLDQAYAATHNDATVGPHVMLAVSDDGPGMDEKTKTRIFDPFFTTKQSGKGTGLGLAMVYGIVRQHGGNIYVYSEVGQGTTIKIYLPQVSDEPEKPVERVSMADLPTGNENLLLVEDDEVVRNFLRNTLTRLGYQVLDSSDGPGALAMLEEKQISIDLLVTDVIMPKMSGKELAQRLSSGRPDLKVLYISGYTDNIIAHHGALDPGVEFLQKPVTIKTLAQKVRDVLDR